MSENEINFNVSGEVKIGDNLSIEDKANNYISTTRLLLSGFQDYLTRAMQTLNENADTLLQGQSMSKEANKIRSDMMKDLLEIEGNLPGGLTKETILSDNEKLNISLYPELLSICDEINKLREKYKLLREILLNLIPENFQRERR